MNTKEFTYPKIRHEATVQPLKNTITVKKGKEKEYEQALREYIITLPQIIDYSTFPSIKEISLYVMGFDPITGELFPGWSGFEHSIQAIEAIKPYISSGIITYEGEYEEGEETSYEYIIEDENFLLNSTHGDTTTHSIIINGRIENM